MNFSIFLPIAECRYVGIALKKFNLLGQYGSVVDYQPMNQEVTD